MVPMADARMRRSSCCLTVILLLGLSGQCFAAAETPKAQKENQVAEVPPSDPNAVATSVPSLPEELKLQKASLIVTPDYIIGPEDVLEITVWKNAELSKTVTVRPDGRISLPLVGDVNAVGRTPVQLTDEISSKLKEFKENPNVSIVVKEVMSYAVFVLGEVKKPGKYPLKSKTTLLQAITIASGFDEKAARNKIVVFRLGSAGKANEKFKASYDDIVLRDGVTQNIELKPGDTVVVPSETMVLIP